MRQHTLLPCPLVLLRSALTEHIVSVSIEAGLAHIMVALLDGFDLVLSER
jgi:hypothetical protein